MLFCKGATTAKKRYQRSVLQFMGAYMVVVLCSGWFVKHDGAEGKFFLYFWSVIPAIPIVAVIVRMGKYLREETDEYQRLLTMQAILVGTGALLAVLVVDDFLRAFANLGGLPPFWGVVIFAFSMGLTGAWQKLRNRAPADA
jgi:lipopolysaccharide export LptBFGC system permease protein LptF